MHDSEKVKAKKKAWSIEIVMRNIPSAAHGQPCFPSLGQKDRGQTDLSLAPIGTCRYCRRLASFSRLLFSRRNIEPNTTQSSPVERKLTRLDNRLVNPSALDEVRMNQCLSGSRVLSL